MKDFGEMEIEHYEKHVIARASNDDYNCEGVIAVMFSSHECGITPFGHCSCYGTFEALSGNSSKGTPQFAWVGTLKEMVTLAITRSCYIFPERKLNPEDSDYKYLIEVYDEIIEKFPFESLMIKEELKGENSGNS